MRGVRLLSRENPAAGPLRAAAIDAGEGDRAHDAVAVHDLAPHLIVEPAGFCGGAATSAAFSAE